MNTEKSQTTEPTTPAITSTAPTTANRCTASTTADSEMSVYTLPACVQCRATLRALASAGLPYTEYGLTEHPDIRQQAIDRGELQAPVVIDADGALWGGFRPDLITAAAQKRAR